MATSPSLQHPTNRLAEALKPSQLKSDISPDWCPGCGDFGILNAIQQAVAGLKLKPWETMYFSGVGCSGKTNHYVKVYGAHTLHGRVLPYALGFKLANPKITVIAGGGDGDGYGIGAGHFVHAGRRNIDATYIVFNNEVYGLTKGQASPTLARGAQPKSLALPNINQAINPLALAIACGYTFVARSYSYDAKHLKATLMAAIEHKGMALVDVLQPCPTYNNLHDKDYFSDNVQMNGAEVPRVYYLDETGYDGVVKDSNDIAEVTTKREQALARAYHVEDRVPLGVYYKIDIPTYHDLLGDNIPILNGVAPLDLSYHDEKMIANTDLSNAWGDLVL